MFVLLGLEYENKKKEVKLGSILRTLLCVSAKKEF